MSSRIPPDSRRRTSPFAVAAIVLGLTWAPVAGCAGSDDQDPVDPASTIEASGDQRADVPSAPPPPAQHELAGEQDRKSSSGQHHGEDHVEDPKDGNGDSAHGDQPPADSDGAKAQKDRDVSEDAPENLSDNEKEHAGGSPQPEQELSDSAKDR